MCKGGKQGETLEEIVLEARRSSHPVLVRREGRRQRKKNKGFRLSSLGAERRFFRRPPLLRVAFLLTRPRLAYFSSASSSVSRREQVPPALPRSPLSGIIKRKTPTKSVFDRGIRAGKENAAITRGFWLPRFSSRSSSARGSPRGR